jgi:hypothetical protein
MVRLSQIRDLSSCEFCVLSLAARFSLALSAGSALFIGIELVQSA